jgi:hypothetical protein
VVALGSALVVILAFNAVGYLRRRMHAKHLTSHRRAGGAGGARDVSTPRIVHDRGEWAS